MDSRLPVSAIRGLFRAIESFRATRSLVDARRLLAAVDHIVIEVNFDHVYSPAQREWLVRGDADESLGTEVVELVRRARDIAVVRIADAIVADMTRDEEEDHER